MNGYGPAGSDGRRDPPQNIATAITEVSERATQLVREEIELAKAEVAEKAGRLVRGAIVGAAAGIFLVMALVFVLIGVAWLLYWVLPVGTFAYFWGFFAMAAILVLLGALAGLIAAKAVKRGTPPVPTMAIDEAKKIRDVVSNPPPAARIAEPPAAAAAAAPPAATDPREPAPATAEASTEQVAPAGAEQVASAEAEQVAPAEARERTDSEASSDAEAGTDAVESAA